MHILVLPSWYPTKENPNNGIFFAEQAAALAEFGHRVSVVALYGDAPHGLYIEEKTHGRLREFALHYNPLPLHLTYFRIMAAVSGLFSKELSGDRPDLVHVHSFRAARYARALKAFRNIPYVVTEHVSWFERGLLSEKDRRSAAAGYAHASAVIAVSEGLRDQIAPLSRIPVRVIPNMVDDRFFRTDLKKHPGEGFRFLSVGSLNRNKGMDVVLDAFSEAFRSGNSLTLTICGDGEERDALERRAAELGLGTIIRFTGQISRAECAEYMSECDAFVLASRVETFGIVLAEAMACGRPVVMTKTGAWRQIVSDSTGIAVDVDDIPALSQAMQSVAGNEGWYDPTEIRAYCRDRFSAQAVCASLTKVYEEVLRSP